MIADKPIADVTIEDIDARFAANSWALAGGNGQSMLFAAAALRYLPPDILTVMGDPVDATLVDYGCAEGDGTAMLAANFPPVNVMGCDISPVAVTHARQRYPLLRFEVDDIRTPRFNADCIWTSHTLEHLPNPAAAVSALRSLCKLLIVLVPPIETESQRDSGPHVNAPLTAEWLQELSVPIFQKRFTVYRRDIPYNHVLLQEESLILVWEGSKLQTS